MSISKWQAENFADNFNMSNLRQESNGEWYADDIYTLENDGVEGVDTYHISHDNYQGAIAEGDLTEDPFDRAWVETFGTEYD